MPSAAAWKGTAVGTAVSLIQRYGRFGQVSRTFGASSAALDVVRLTFWFWAFTTIWERWGG